MSAPLLRRTGRALVDDAIERLRGDVSAVALLHVLPSLPFFAGVLVWTARIDLRGAIDDDATWPLAALVVPKVLGWGALAAWAAAAARTRPCGPAAAWGRAFARLPEVLLAGLVASGCLLLGMFTLIGFLGIAAAGVGLAATVSPGRAGGMTMVRQGLSGALEDIVRCTGVLFVSGIAAVFVAVNLLVLPHLLVQFGAGGFGLDLNLLTAAMGIDRAGTWAFAALTASMIVEAVLVVAFVELHRDREAEREGLRFETFAEELEARDVAAPRLRQGSVA